MEKSMTSLTWYLTSKKVQERLFRCTLCAITVVCFTVGIAWVYSGMDSMDPSFILAQGRPWGGVREQKKDNSSEVLDGQILITQEQLNDTDEHERRAGDHDVDDRYFIRQTGIRGKNAVDQFRARTACLGTSGRWVYDPIPRKLPWIAVKGNDWVRKCDKEHTKYRSGLSGLQADSIALSNGPPANWSVREELKWVWRTDESNCPWHPLDRDELCRRIGSNRNVLIVGDSINEEISVALHNALMMNKSSVGTPLRDAGSEMCSDVLGGEGKGFVVFFVRNDYVSTVVNTTKFARNIEDPWIPRLDNGDGDIKILILNRGAHFQDDRTFVGGLRDTFTALRDRHPDLLVIYRNTPSGHVNCTDFHAPIDKPLKGAQPSFHWEEFDRQNALAKDIVEEFQHIYLDVASAIGMRPEGHKHSRDCLHYCQPGPLDHVVEMIYNALLLLS